MRASRILVFARTMRWASVGAGVRKACAISSVLRPQTSRNVSATCASAESAGWQHVKIRRRRSSSISLTSCSSAEIVSACASSSGSNRARRRMASIALKRPADTSQARGLSGTPSCGHCSSAARNASCSASSARSKSPSRRTSVANTRRDSARYTASILSFIAEKQGRSLFSPRKALVLQPDVLVFPERDDAVAVQEQANHGADLGPKRPDDEIQKHHRGARERRTGQHEKEPALRHLPSPRKKMWRGTVSLPPDSAEGR